MNAAYLEQMQAHLDEGGTLTHRNGVELLAEIMKLRVKLKDARNRLDTIRETNPEIALDYDIERIDVVLSGECDECHRHEMHIERLQRGLHEAIGALSEDAPLGARITATKLIRGLLPKSDSVRSGEGPKSG